MEDSHKNNTSEPGSAVQGAHISHIAQQVSPFTLPLPRMEPYSWPVQGQMEYRDFRH
uniref:Uncharacterized protein n=1 Tax=Microcebus murinus TaxID=30608 RepID=A0A8C6EKE8_MICMU